MVELGFEPRYIWTVGEGNAYPLQYSCLENSMNRGAWQVTVHWSQRVGHDWSDLAHTLTYMNCRTFAPVLYPLLSKFGKTIRKKNSPKFCLCYWSMVLVILLDLYNHTNFPSSAAATAKSLQSCLTPCDPIDGSPPGSPVPGILQARTLERVAISFSSLLGWLKICSL